MGEAQAWAASEVGAKTMTLVGAASSPCLHSTCIHLLLSQVDDGTVNWISCNDLKRGYRCYGPVSTKLTHTLCVNT